MTIYRTFASRALVFLLFSGFCIGENTAAAPSGFQQVTSAHATFEYLLPSEWVKSGLNAYEGQDGRAMEQIYPSAEVTAEYCHSFGTPDREGYRTTEVENRVYNNGHVRGCYTIRDVLNTRLEKEWRHTSFKFATGRGVEDLTVVVTKESYNEPRLKTIVDSIQILPASSEVRAVTPTVLDPPDFKSKPLTTFPQKAPVGLQLVSANKNKITDTTQWFAKNSLLLNESKGAVPAALPREIAGASLLRTIRSGGHFLGIYGSNFGNTYIIAATTEDGTFEYAFDFSRYRLAPRNVHAEIEFVNQRVTWAEQQANVLYVAHGHNTYARSSYGMTGYVSAIDVKMGKAMWHSAPLVSNASNFTILGDGYLATGYGFTAEPDYVYLLRASDGAAVARVPVKSGPEYLIPYGDRLYVRTYNTDYVFRVIGHP